MKNILKKLLTGIVALCMLPIIPASAEDAELPAPKDWTLTNTLKDYEGMTTAVGAVNGAGVDGSTALYIKTSKKPEGSDYSKFISAKTNISYNLKQGETYHLSFYAKPLSGNLGNTHMDAVTNIAGLGSNNITITQLENGWQKFDKELTVNSNGSKKLLIKCYNTSDFYIDNISLTDTNGYNYIVNGDFEDYDYGNTTLAKWGLMTTAIGNFPQSYIGFDKNFGCAALGSVIVNASYTWAQAQGNSYMQLKSSKSFNFVSGKTYKVAYSVYNTRLGKNSGIGNTHVILGGLSFNAANANTTSENIGNDWTRYEKTCTMTSDKTGPLEFKILGEGNYIIDDIVLTEDGSNNNLLDDGGFASLLMIDKNREKPVSEWLVRDVDMGNYSDSYIGLAEGMGHNDERSMHVKSTWKWADSKNTRMFMESSMIKLEGGSSYKVSFYINDGATGLGDVAITQGSGRITSFTSTDEGNGWKKYEKVFTQASDSYTPFKMEVISTADFYIDDIAIYKLNAEGREQGDNIVANGSFALYETVKAAENKYEAADWTSEKNGAALNNPIIVSEIVDSGARNGNYAAYISYPEAATGNSFVYLNQRADIPAGDYTLTLYTKGHFNALDNGTGFSIQAENVEIRANTNASDHKKGVSSFVTADANGWKKYTIGLHLESPITYFRIIADRYVDYMYIDDISIVDSSGKEYIKNGGFESSAEINRTDIKDLFAYPTANGGAGVISWQNPRNTIDSIKLYVNGTEYETEEINTEASARNEILVPGLVNGTPYTIKAELKIGDTTTEYSTQLTPFAGDLVIGGWTIVRHDSANYANAVAEILTSGGSNNSSAVKIVSHRNGVRANAYIDMHQSAEVDLSNNYKLSFKAKMQGNTAKTLQVAQQYDPLNVWDVYTLENATDDNPNIEIGDADADGFRKYSFYFENTYASGSYKANYMIIIQDRCDEFIIDDIELYELDADYEPIGVNLFRNGDLSFNSFSADIPELAYNNEGTWLTGINQIWDDGLYKAAANIFNISEDDLKVTLYIAVYDEDGLKSVLPTTANIAKNNKAVTTISAEMNVSDITNNTKIKAMLWRGITPLTIANTIIK